MKGKQLGILIILVAALGGAGYVLYNKQNASWESGNSTIGKKLLGDKFPINDVTAISIQQGTNEVNLVKKDDLWRVSERTDYPANFSKISGFLLKARDLKIVQSEEVGPSQLPRLDLAPSKGTNSPITVAFKGQNDKPIKMLLLGKQHIQKPSQEQAQQFGGSEGWPDGRYVKVGDSKTVAVISDPLE